MAVDKTHAQMDLNGLAVHMEGIKLEPYFGFKTTIDEVENVGIGGSIILKRILKIEYVNRIRGAELS
jgi:hypothetical protein